MPAFSVFAFKPQVEGYLLGLVQQNLWILLLYPFSIGLRYPISLLSSISPSLHLLLLPGVLGQSSPYLWRNIKLDPFLTPDIEVDSKCIQM